MTFSVHVDLLDDDGELPVAYTYTPEFEGDWLDPAWLYEEGLA